MIITNQLKTLEFLIPSYKRPHTVIEAVKSVALQVEKLQLSSRVKITIVDDCSPNINSSEMINNISAFSSFVTFKQNTVNKGMSLNIRDMVANSDADFCTILTDDDRLQPDSLKQIIETIDKIDKNDSNSLISSFFVPRYSYLEDKSLNCIVCQPFEEDTLIKASPLNSIKNLHNGFILTGLFFRPKLINFNLWDDNIENSFFPVIYFADLLLNYDCLFINKNWFIHTVLNECHWDSWGKTEQARQARLYKDYMKAVTVSSQRAISRLSGMLTIIPLWKEEFICYQRQIECNIQKLNPNDRKINPLTFSRISYKLAIVNFYISRLKYRIRIILSKIKRLVINIKTIKINSIS